MSWCEENRIDFLFGLARNMWLIEEISIQLANRGRPERTGSRRDASRTSLFDARQLVPSPPGPRQGRTRGQGPQPALPRRPRCRQPSMSWPSRKISIARAATRRTGSRNASSICSPTPPPPPRCAPLTICLLVRLVRLCLDPRPPAPPRPCPIMEQLRRATRSAPSASAAEDRRVRSGQRTPHPHRARLSLPASRRVRPGACQAARAARLSRKPDAVERMTPTAAVAPIDSLMVADPQDTPPYRETDVSTAEAGQNTASCPPISRRDRPDTRGSVRYPG